MLNNVSVLTSFFTLALFGLLPKPASAAPGCPQAVEETEPPLGLGTTWPYLVVPLLHRQHQVILDLFLAVLAGAVEVILLLQLPPPLLAHVEEIHVGHGQLIPGGDLAQCPQLDPGCEEGKKRTWRSECSH